jgi:hypothetical protein
MLAFDVVPRCSLSSLFTMQRYYKRKAKGELSRLIETYRDLSRLIGDLSGLIESGKYDKQRDCESFVTNVTNVTPIFSTFLFSEEKNWEI